MKVITTISDLHKALKQLRQTGKTVGLVPTMGYFHQGHLELMRQARMDCDVVVVSLYVNPTQFAPSEDLEAYPRDLERDRKLAESEDVDFLFHPSDEEMYPNNHLTFVEVQEMTNKLCGVSRPHHFKGVTTIVAKLFNIVQPERAYFGQKDAQQVAVIKRMVEELNFPLHIVVVPTVREEDGLAMSSRNTYLSEPEREEALVLAQSLERAKEMINKGCRIASEIKNEMQEMIEDKPLVDLEYISVCDNKELQEISFIEGEILIAVAARVGKARLIDNIMIKANKNGGDY